MACVIDYPEIVQTQYCLVNLPLLKIFHCLYLHPLFNIFFIFLESCMSEGKRKILKILNINSALSPFCNLVFKKTPPSIYTPSLYLLFLPPYLYSFYLLPPPNRRIFALHIFTKNLLYNLCGPCSQSYLSVD